MLKVWVKPWPVASLAGESTRPRRVARRRERRVHRHCAYRYPPGVPLLPARRHPRLCAPAASEGITTPCPLWRHLHGGHAHRGARRLAEPIHSECVRDASRFPGAHRRSLRARAACAASVESLERARFGVVCARSIVSAPAARLFASAASGRGASLRRLRRPGSILVRQLSLNAQPALLHALQRARHRAPAIVRKTNLPGESPTTRSHIDRHRLVQSPRLGRRLHRADQL